MENLTQKNSKAEARNLESPVGGTAIDHVKTEESADEKNEETSITVNINLCGNQLTQLTNVYA